MKAFLLNAMSWLFSLIHPRFAWIVARPVGWITWSMSRRFRHVSRINLGLCLPDLPEQEREHIAREAIFNYVRNALEIGVSWHWSERRMERLYAEPVGMQYLEQAKASGRGVVMLGPHHGTWEMFNYRLGPVVDGVALYKPGKDAAVDDLLLKKRGRFGINMVAANRNGLKRLYSELGDGKTVFVLPDQEPRLGSGRFAPLFGVPALTGVLVPRLLQKTGAIAVYAICLRLPKGQYRVHIVPADEEIYSDDLDIAIAALNRGVEECIRLAPEQYLWAYKRFRTRPEGEASFY